MQLHINTLTDEAKKIAEECDTDDLKGVLTECELEEFMKKWTATDLSNGENMHMIGRVSKKDIDFKRYPFKLNVRFFAGARWCSEPHPMGALGHNHHSPGEFGWIE